ncbi:uncharacterized protein LOC109860481 [Pseudomyrmex gracilis]|uniref:uncharacterized protein LOC109860481 n=1 Tax=Pseudomyrmex gracilis TaxID=219809 RepID=UPI000994D6A7|nr:uncharacterized protein LOC109860481 [Pseudomyrmex gracilis]
MKIATIFFFVVVGYTSQKVLCTCVFSSDFGFVLNCAFKKSGLFRVRHLGGAKGYFGLGFSIGDELGFSQSISNLESAKRRSVKTHKINGLVSNSLNMLKHTEFLLKLTATMLCRKQHAEIGLDASKIIILMLKIKNALAHRKSLKTKNWRHYFTKTHVRR